MIKSTISQDIPIKGTRFNFGKLPEVAEMPNLLDIQCDSYKHFLQKNTPQSKRKNEGLNAVFTEIFPISDAKGLISLEYVGYEIGNWKCDCGSFEGLATEEAVCPVCHNNAFYIEKNSIEECKRKALSYSDPLKVKIRMTIKERVSDSEEPALKEIKEEKIYMGEIPLMTKHGSFVINGTERIIVSQLHRSPGIFFSFDKIKSQALGKKIYVGRIIPYRGSWIDFEFDASGVLYTKIDKKKKFPATILLKALGFNNEGLLKTFYKSIDLTYEQEADSFFLPGEHVEGAIGFKSAKDICDASGTPIIKAGKKFTKSTVRKIKKLAEVPRIEVFGEELLGQVIGEDLVNEETGEIYLELNEDITEEVLDRIKGLGQEQGGKLSFSLLNLSGAQRDDTIRRTLMQESTESYEEALCSFYRKMRPSDPPSAELAEKFFHNLFYNPKSYDLSEVGRLKINNRFNEKTSLDMRTLRPEDIINSARYLIELKSGEGQIDDIDNLGNRRVRSVGESVKNIIRIGMMKLERLVSDRLGSTQNVEALMPKDFLSAKPIASAMKEFFCSDPLSQFMDQTNPLSEITHKRRLSALGRGGLTRERAGFEVRDVHPTHYGRICPIETPEGPNIGLISSLATHGVINKHGFIETPYIKVVDGVITEEVVFLTAMEEEKYVIAQLTDDILSKDRKINIPLVSARSLGEFVMVPPSEVDFMDVSPKQLVSVAASLIPFLENDDANRALMGSNMQRQAVPLVRSESPFVGTGMERKVACDSGAVILSDVDGEVVHIDATTIVVKSNKQNSLDESGFKIYKMTKFQRSNQNTCINFKPTVNLGDKVVKGSVLADGPNVQGGELALGKNVLVAFMSWNGYNFEDAIIISERLVKNDTYTSLHIEEMTVEARETRNGREEITREIPNCKEEHLVNLDESGIIKLGTAVKPGDILVGKITPKGETMLSSEEKLLKAIFGEKACDYRDTSLRAGSSVEGTVIDVQIFNRKGETKDSRSIYLENAEVKEVEETVRLKEKLLREDCVDSLTSLLNGKTVKRAIKVGSVSLKKGDTINGADLSDLALDDFEKIAVTEEGILDQVHTILTRTHKNQKVNRITGQDKIEKIRKGNELPASVIKSVKINILVKRKLQVGDKMAGRHGNKGVVSIIVPEEDMPYMEDGRPIDIILNPLGVPSRMNVGQILETSLGLVAHEKQQKMATPIFDGATVENIQKELTDRNYDPSGGMYLFDGKTGDRFDQRIVVGYIYMLKLHHLVDEKIHARSTGPYSLVTQQPLGGKAQFGGQRLGEMEVWALEAYGAAHTLQEMITVKSDDTEGRKKMYENIVKGKHSLKPNLPESFNVLVRELQSLCLDVELLKDNDDNN